METPDITPLQIRAVVVWFVNLLSLFGLAVSTETSDKVIGLLVGAAIALPVIMVYADAVIRRARANNAADIAAAKLSAPLYAPPAPSFVNES
jgi:hypothetical protein